MRRAAVPKCSSSPLDDALERGVRRCRPGSASSEPRRARPRRARGRRDTCRPPGRCRRGRRDEPWRHGRGERRGPWTGIRTAGNRHAGGPGQLDVEPLAADPAVDVEKHGRSRRERCGDRRGHDATERETTASRNSLVRGWSPTKKNASEERDADHLGDDHGDEQHQQQDAESPPPRPRHELARAAQGADHPTGRDGRRACGRRLQHEDGPRARTARTARSPSERQPVREDRYRCGRASVGTHQHRGRSR